MLKKQADEYRSKSEEERDRILAELTRSEAEKVKLLQELQRERDAIQARLDHNRNPHEQDDGAEASAGSSQNDDGMALDADGANDDSSPSSTTPAAAAAASSVRGRSIHAAGASAATAATAQMQRVGATAASSSVVSSSAIQRPVGASASSHDSSRSLSPAAGGLPSVGSVQAAAVSGGKRASSASASAAAGQREAAASASAKGIVDNAAHGSASSAYGSALSSPTLSKPASAGHRTGHGQVPPSTASSSAAAPPSPLAAEAAALSARGDGAPALAASASAPAARHPIGASSSASASLARMQAPSGQMSAPPASSSHMAANRRLAALAAPGASSAASSGGSGAGGRSTHGGSASGTGHYADGKTEADLRRDLARCNSIIKTQQPLLAQTQAQIADLRTQKARDAIQRHRAAARSRRIADILLVSCCDEIMFLCGHQPAPPEALAVEGTVSNAIARAAQRIALEQSVFAQAVQQASGVSSADVSALTDASSAAMPMVTPAKSLLRMHQTSTSGSAGDVQMSVSNGSSSSTGGAGSTSMLVSLGSYLTPGTALFVRLNTGGAQPQQEMQNGMQHTTPDDRSGGAFNVNLAANSLHAAPTPGQTVLRQRAALFGNGSSNNNNSPGQQQPAALVRNTQLSVHTAIASSQASVATGTAGSAGVAASGAGVDGGVPRVGTQVVSQSSTHAQMQQGMGSKQHGGIVVLSGTTVSITQAQAHSQGTGAHYVSGQQPGSHQQQAQSSAVSDVYIADHHGQHVYECLRLILDGSQSLISILPTLMQFSGLDGSTRTWPPTGGSAVGAPCPPLQLFTQAMARKVLLVLAATFEDVQSALWRFGAEADAAAPLLMSPLASSSGVGSSRASLPASSGSTVSRLRTRALEALKGAKVTSCAASSHAAHKAAGNASGAGTNGAKYAPWWLVNAVRMLPILASAAESELSNSTVQCEPGGHNAVAGKQLASMSTVVQSLVSLMLSGASASATGLQPLPAAASSVLVPASLSPSLQPVAVMVRQLAYSLHSSARLIKLNVINSVFLLQTAASRMHRVAAAQRKGRKGKAKPAAAAASKASGSAAAAASSGGGAGTARDGASTARSSIGGGDPSSSTVPPLQPHQQQQPQQAHSVNTVYGQEGCNCAAVISACQHMQQRIRLLVDVYQFARAQSPTSPAAASHAVDVGSGAGVTTSSSAAASSAFSGVASLDTSTGIIPLLAAVSWVLEVTTLTSSFSPTFVAEMLADVHSAAGGSLEQQQQHVRLYLHMLRSIARVQSTAIRAIHAVAVIHGSSSTAGAVVSPALQSQKHGRGFALLYGLQMRDRQPDDSLSTASGAHINGNVHMNVGEGNDGDHWQIPLASTVSDPDVAVTLLRLAVAIVARSNELADLDRQLQSHAHRRASTGVDNKSRMNARATTTAEKHSGICGTDVPAIDSYRSDIVAVLSAAVALLRDVSTYGRLPNFELVVEESIGATSPSESGAADGAAQRKASPAGAGASSSSATTTTSSFLSVSDLPTMLKSAVFCIATNAKNRVLLPYSTAAAPASTPGVPSTAYSLTSESIVGNAAAAAAPDAPMNGQSANAASAVSAMMGQSPPSGPTTVDIITSTSTDKEQWSSDALMRKLHMASVNLQRIGECGSNKDDADAAVNGGAPEASSSSSSAAQSGSVHKGHEAVQATASSSRHVAHIAVTLAQLTTAGT